jgi:glycerol uptake facilitator-like aquaporin
MSAPDSQHTGARASLAQQLLAEFSGTAALLCAVIGSGIMAERLSGGNMGVALLANTLATVFALYVLIESLGPVSGAHFNPLVTLVMWSKGQLAHVEPAKLAIFFIVFQLLGAVVGAWAAHAMFDLPVLQFSTKLRGGFSAAGQFSGWGQWLAEGVATAGLIFVILRSPPGKASALVACYIGAACIAPASALGFVVAQAVGAVGGTVLARALDAPQG